MSDVARTSIHIDSNADRVVADLRTLNTQVNTLRSRQSVGFNVSSLTAPIINQIRSIANLGGMGGGNTGVIGSALFGSGGGASIATGGLAAVGVGAIAAKLAVLKLELEGFKKVATAGISFNIDKENNLAKLGVLTQDKPFAKDLMQQIQDYAAKTPYTTKGLMPASSILSQYGAKNQDLMGLTQLLGATSMGNADNMQSQALAMGQMISKGKLMAQERNQFINAGVNPVQLISEQSKGKLSMSQLAKDMEDGKVSANMVIEAMQKATEEGGRFNGAMDEMSKTFSGKFSTLTDDFDIFSGKVAEPIFDFLKVQIQDAISLFDNLGDTDLADIKTAVSSELIPALEETKKIIMDIFELDENSSMSENIQKVVRDVGAAIDALNTVIVAGKKIGDVFLIVYDVMKLVANSITFSFAGIGDGLERIINGVMALSNGFTGITKKANGFLTGNKELSASGDDDLSMAKSWSKDIFSGDTWGSGQMATDTQDMKDALEGIKNRTADLFGVGGGAGYTPNARTASDIKASSITGDYSGGGVDKASSLNKIADAFDNIAKSIDSAISKMSGFDTVFNKLSYERFSPEKIKNRLTKYFREISDWKNNLDALSTKISPDQLGQLQSMGISGFGLTKGLSKMNDSDLANAQSMLSGIKGVSLNTSLQNLQIEHFGTIQMQGINNEGELKAVINSLASDVIRDKRSQSLSPAIMDLFK